MHSTAVSGTSFKPSATAECGLIPPTDIPLVWHRIAEILEETQPEWLDRMEPVELLGWLYAGKYDLWAGTDKGILDGFILCRWESWTKVKFYCIEAVFGQDMRKYLPWGLEKVERFAAIMGAKEVVIDGRMDLQRMFHRWGYSPKAVTLRKDVRVLWRN